VRHSTSSGHFFGVERKSLFLCSSGLAEVCATWAKPTALSSDPAVTARSGGRSVHPARRGSLHQLPIRSDRCVQYPRTQGVILIYSKGHRSLILNQWSRSKIRPSLLEAKRIVRQSPHTRPSSHWPATPSPAPPSTHLHPVPLPAID
jgi:hypothetical protein